MKAKFVLAGVVAAVVVLAIGVSLLSKRGPNSSSATQDDSRAEAQEFVESWLAENLSKEERKEAIERYQSLDPEERRRAADRSRQAVEEQLKGLFDQAFDVRGIVVDTKGSPIRGAEVTVSGIQFYDRGETRKVATNESGHFEALGLRGGAVRATAAKDGYYSIASSSMSSLDAAWKSGGAVRLVLKEPINPVELARIGFRSPLGKSYLQLPNLKVSADQPHHFVVDLSSARTDLSQRRGYHWEVKLAAPGGGLAERKEQFDFVAPETGYVSDVGYMQPADGETWRSRFEQDYFVSFSNGQFGRIRVSASVTSSSPQVTIGGYVNPTPGDRNLELAE